MPSEIINRRDLSQGDSGQPEEYPTQAFMSWGWNDGCAALLHINYLAGGVSVALEWEDLDRLNRMVRRAMKSYKKRPPSLLPMPDETDAYLTAK